MPFLAPRYTFPTTARRSVRRRQTRLLMGRFGLTTQQQQSPLFRLFPRNVWGVPGVSTVPLSINPPIGPQQVPGIRPGASSAAASATAGTPVPTSFPTNQLFVNSDGSQWIYSAAQGRWISVGTPYNVGATPISSVAAAPSASTAPTTPVSVSVTPAAAPAVNAPSPYQSILDFATESSLIPGAPNWAVALGAIVAYKLFESKISSGGRRGA